MEYSFFSSRRRHTRSLCDWSSDVCSSDLATLSAAALAQLSSLLGNLTLFALIVLFVTLGAWRKVAVYDSFIEGAKEGFDVAKGLLPYLVAMLCAVGVFRASGALEYALSGIR